MAEAASSLLSATISQIEAGWANRLAVPISALHVSGITFASKVDSKGLVVLELQDSVVAVCPPPLIPILSPLSQIELLDLEVLLQILIEFQPNPIGIATISYVDSATLSEISNSYNAHTSNSNEVEVVLSSCSPDEQVESGISTMPFLFSAKTEDGSIGASAGYEIWNSKIAQMGVLAMPNYRGTGLAFAAAHAAAHGALKSELVPQWRCRIGNKNSYRLSQQLGFQSFGRQLAIDLTW